MERLNESRICGVIAEAFAVRASVATSSTLHAQHGAGVFVGLDGDVTVTERGGACARGRVVVIPPDLPHAAHSPGPTVGMLYDPEKCPHVAGHARLRGGAYVLEGPLAARLRGAVAAHRASLFHGEVLEGLTLEASAWFAAPRRELDRRVACVLEALRSPTAEGAFVRPSIGVSAAHLQALFVRDVGVPIRTFRLWRRLLAALSAFTRTDATRAAHLSGFSDLAHFSRTCRKMLGYSPTTLRDGGSIRT